MQMFQSATLKLTVWYLAIIMAISLLFSFVIYQLNFHEVSVRLENFEAGLLGVPVTEEMQTGVQRIRQIQVDQASFQMVMSLVYINLFILIAGGVGSYLLARRTLKPIEEAHEAQSRFTSDASHELRTPLAAMKTEIEVTLRDPKINEQEARELLESNLEEVEKLIQLSEMLLDLSRLDYDHLEMHSIDLPLLLTETLKTFKQDRKRFEITGRKLARVYGNRAAINELMTILIDNALQYSKPGSVITLRIFQQYGQVGFAITNVGPTIDAKAQTHIFERFYRADTSRTNSAKNGYGLGLAIAKKIIDVHNGEITVESSNEQTTFTFLLPSPKRLRAKTDEA
jgi:signal transduction histidine kinase